MAKSTREQAWTLTDEEIEAKIAEFREQLTYCHQLYSELLTEGVFAHFYVGRDSRTETYLPEHSVFKRNRIENFG